MTPGPSAVQVECKRCKRKVSMKDVTLDPVYKMVVCNLCVQERRKGETKKPEPKRPVDWDDEDARLERMAKVVPKQEVNAKKIDSEHVKYKCPKCGYKFTYNIITKLPKHCTYCECEVGKVRTD